MPGIVLHFLVAEKTLERWAESSEPPPFDPHDPSAVNAFFHGAVGPDLGYFPGGDRFLSDLAHCHKTGHLTRALISRARTDTERAFAWGWLTHVLADRAIHPWIGRMVGQLTRGSSDIFVDGATDPCAHLQVELGVDTWFGVRNPGVRSVRLQPVFGKGEASLLIEAYELVYGVFLPEEVFVRSHQAVSVRVGQALATMGVLHALRTGGPVERRLPAFPRLIRRALSTQRFRSVALSYLVPVTPPRWLHSAVERELQRQPDLFLAHHRQGVTGLGDHNLDTGRPTELDPLHPGTMRALAALDARSVS